MDYTNLLALGIFTDLMKQRESAAGMPAISNTIKESWEWDIPMALGSLCPYIPACFRTVEGACKKHAHLCFPPQRKTHWFLLLWQMLYD